MFLEHHLCGAVWPIFFELKETKKRQPNKYRSRLQTVLPSSLFSGLSSSSTNQTNLRRISSHQSGSSMVGANIATSAVVLKSFRLIIPKYSKLGLLSALSCAKLMPIQLMFSNHDRPFRVCKFKRMTWSLRSAADDNRLNSSPTNESSGGTRLIRTIQAIQMKIISRLKELMKNLPVKIFSFLVGFYCATAFATVIGQTGDWDVLSAALTVAVVEGIGALMYKASLPLVDNIRNIIIIFNYWKAGLSLGLFLDSFKY